MQILKTRIGNYKLEGTIESFLPIFRFPPVFADSGVCTCYLEGPARVTSRSLHVLPRGVCTCNLEGFVNVSSNARYHGLDD